VEKLFDQVATTNHAMRDVIFTLFSASTSDFCRSHNLEHKIEG